MHEPMYDVAIIGGGIGGSTLAAILARHGVDVLLIEGGSHPRFTIGESTIPETTLLLRAIARRFDVPELAYLSTYDGLRTYVSTACGVKRNFSFFQHADGEPVDPRHATQLSTFSPPLGPDGHLFRQDVDAWLYFLALRYGATGVTNTKIEDVEIGEKHVELRTAGGQAHRARYVVDAGGIRAVLPQVLGLRESPARFETRSRSIFTHMVGVKPWEHIVGDRSAHHLPSPPSQGTLHHMFDGGWAWIIPFDNHPRSTNPLCSVGISLDLAKHPYSGDAPEEEFWQIVSRFPSLSQQLGKAAPVRDFIGSRANQFSSNQVAGDRWFLLPHASNFIDPLFSSGLSVTFWAVNQLAPRLLHSVQANHFCAADLQPVVEWTEKCFAYYDTLVSRSYKCFHDFDLWNAWYRVWVLGSLYGNSGLIGVLSRSRGGIDDPAWKTLETAPYRGVQSVDYPEFAALLEAAATEVDDYSSGRQSAGDAAANIFGHIEASGMSPGPLPMLNPKAHAPAGVLTLFPLARLRAWGWRAPRHVRGRYFTSGFWLVSFLLALHIGHEVGQAFSGLRHLIRDTLAGWNRDWKRRVPRPAAAHGPREQG
ncbi:MAG TPA: tryptophan 7-halogenase [Streptosporangiaceae bacterium]